MPRPRQESANTRTRAFVGDISPDQSTIYIGTQVGDLYEIDPVAMAVKARIPAVQIGPRVFQPMKYEPLADGRLALLSGEGAFPAVDGFSAVGFGTCNQMIS